MASEPVTSIDPAIEPDRGVLHALHIQESSFAGPPEVSHVTPAAGDAGIGAGGQEFVYEAAGWEPVPDPEARHAVSEPAIEAGA